MSTIAVGADFNLAFSGATLKQLKSVENKVIFGAGVKGEDEPVATQEVGEEGGRESEETRSGSVEEGEEQTSQPEAQESESEGDEGQTDEQEHEQSQYYLDQHDFIAAIDSVLYR